MALDPFSPCHLLDLPRELRDTIIDDVLLTGKIPSETFTPNGRADWRIYIPPLSPEDAPLVRTCHQLNAETTQRAAALDVPLILDVCVLSNWRVRCTWLNIPCRKKWEGIRTEVNVRIGRNPPDYERLEPFDCSECAEAFNLREHTVGQAVGTALLQTLKATSRNTTIVRLRINVDAVSALTHREDGVEECAWPKRELLHFTFGVMNETRRKLFLEEEYDPMVVLEQVRKMEWWTQGALTKDWDFDRMLRDDVECREFPREWSEGARSFKAWRRRFRKKLRGWE